MPSALWWNLMSVPPSTSLSRYWTFDTAPNDMNSGPHISSSVGRLMDCTCAHRCPLSSPRSRNQRPPGQGSIFIDILTPSMFSFAGPSCSSSASKVCVMVARTRVSCVIFSVKFSVPVIVELVLMLSLLKFFTARCSWLALLGFLVLGLSPFLDPAQLMRPETLERFGPVVNRADSLSIGSIKHVSSIPAHPDQSHVTQHPQML